MSFDIRELSAKAVDAVRRAVGPSISDRAELLIRQEIEKAFLAGRDSAFDDVNAKLHPRREATITTVTPQEMALRTSGYRRAG